MVKHPHPNGGCGIIKADGQELPPAVKGHSQVAGASLVALPLNGAIIEPGMSLAQCALCGGGYVEGDALVAGGIGCGHKGVIVTPLARQPNIDSN